MLLLLYLVLVLLLLLATRKLSESLKRTIRLVYNYLFVLVTQTVITAVSSEVINFSEIAKILGKSMFMSVQYLTFGGDINWANQMSVSFQAQLWVITFIAALLTAKFVAVLLFNRRLNQLKLRVTGCFEKEQYVIRGKADDAGLLVADIRRRVKNPYIIYIPTQPLADTDSLYDFCRIEKKELLGHLNKNKKYKIVLLPDAGYDNLGILYQLQNDWEDSEKISVTAFLDNDVIRFEDMCMDHIDAYLVSKEQLAVQRYFNVNECMYMPVNMLKRTHSFSESGDLPYLTEPFDICMIGFDSIGQEFLLSAFENAAFLTRDGKESFRALVFDEEMSVKKEKFLTDVPYFAGSGQIDFADTGIHTPEYFKTIGARIDSFKQIIIATRDTQLNIEAAIKLRRYFNRIGRYDRRPEILIILNEPCPGIEHLLEQYPEIKILDVNDRIINYETLIARSIDAKARATHEQYCKANHKTTKWEELGTFTQASNRAANLDAYNKKALFELCRGEEKDKMDFLAQYEHSRWSAFHYAHGWRSMPVSDLTDEERAGCNLKHPKEKRHACLVPWDELDALPQKEPGKLKDYDMDNVRDALTLAHE
ncbi:MAG: hypothetical protein NC417_01740 [Candidatus Gastranaerophilales bacterium]|nr:hypothetical protein [Candidatus Gastranaerophilales bacterium]